MIQQASAASLGSEMEGSPSATAPAPALTSLPAEIVESVYGHLDIHDQLQLVRTCKLLHSIWVLSSTLQYRFTLQTSAYIDVKPLPPSAFDPPMSPDDDSMPLDPDNEVSLVPSVTFAAPHPRQTVSATSTSGSSLRDRPVKPIDASSSTVEKYRALRDRERRWETMDPAVVRSLRVGGPAGVYELQEGIFLMCDDYLEGEGSRPMAIRLIPLPSAQDPDLDDPILPVKSHRLDFPISDLTMDPTQDLIVVSEFLPRPGLGSTQPTHRYHLLTLSTFQPHPLATLPTLDFPPCTQPHSQTRQLLQVMDDVLVVLVSRYVVQWLLAGLGGFGGAAPFGNEEEIVCWNWKTGKVLGRICLPENGWFASFAMLTPTSFMVTSTSSFSPILPSETRIATAFPPVIQIYTILPDPANNIIPVQPLEADYMDDTTARPILVAELGLPTFADDVMVSGFDVRPDPPFPVSKTAGCGSSRKAFTQDPEKGVMVFELMVSEPPDPTFGRQQHQRRTQSYELFVLRETLVQRAKDGEHRLMTQFAEREQGRTDFAYWRVEEYVRWPKWGEDGSRMMETSMAQRAWVCSCSGYRFVSLEPCLGSNQVEDEEQPERIHAPPRLSDIRLFDFSPFNIDRPLSHATKDTDKVDVFVRTAPTVLDRRRIWLHDVTTRLPYQEIVNRQRVVANGVMIDDQRVIVVCTRGRRNGDWSTVRQEMTVYCM